MPSFSQPIVNDRIIIDVWVSHRPGQPETEFKALLDTGATATGISPQVVQQLGLSPTGTDTLTVASGQSFQVFQYHARVAIPIAYNVAHPPGLDRFHMGKHTPVVGLPYQPDDYDVILGMDLLSIFHVTLYQGVIILSN